MPNELLLLHGDEVSLVKRAANRHRFLLRKGDGTMDDVKAIQLLEKLDEAGQSDVLEALTAEDDEFDAAIAKGARRKATEDGEDDEEEEEELSEEQRKRYKAAARILGKGLAKRFLKGMMPMHDEEDEEEEGGKLKRRKTKKTKTPGGKFHEGGPPGEDGEDGAPPKLKKGDDGEYDLSALAKEDRPLVAAILATHDGEMDELRERLTKSDEALAAVLDRQDRQTYFAKAASFKHLPGAKAEDLAVILRKIDRGEKLTPAESKAFYGVLGGANQALAKSAAFGEIGSELQGGDVDSPEAELATRAQDLQKQDPKLTIQQAKSRILKSNTGLQERLNKAQDRRIRAAREE